MSMNFCRSFADFLEDVAVEISEFWDSKLYLDIRNRISGISKWNCSKSEIRAEVSPRYAGACLAGAGQLGRYASVNNGTDKSNRGGLKIS